MTVSTEKLLPGVLPPKEETAGIDFAKILDAFDPSLLDEDQLYELGSRYASITGYGLECIWLESSEDDLDRRIATGRIVSACDRRDLQKWQKQYEDQKPKSYSKARTALIKAIGSKASYYLVQQEKER